MDSASADAVETVPTDPTQYDTPTQTQTQEPNPQTSLDLSGIVDGLSRNDDTIREVSANLDEKVNGVAGQLDELSKTTNELRNEVRASNEQNETNTTTIVVNDAQWSEMQQAWWQARDTLAVAFFLELIITFLAAATLGVHLWSAFSKGWRR